MKDVKTMHLKSDLLMINLQYWKELSMHHFAYDFGT